MSPRRFLIEVCLLGFSAAGAAIGYCAGTKFENPSIQILFAFLGMGLGGAFVELCVRGDSK